MNDAPLAYLVTFTTFGSWLHGDPRGSVNREHSEPGSPYLPPDEHLARAEAISARQSSLVLDSVSRAAVRSAIVDVCAHRQWPLHAVNVRTNHVHVVVSLWAKPEAALHDFKAYATRALRQKKLVNPTVSPWTSGGSTRYLWKSSDVESACRYVIEGQGVDLPSEPPQ